jgi:hypothetical protein
MNSLFRWRSTSICLVALTVVLGCNGCAHLTFETETVRQEPWYDRWFVEKSDGIHYYRPKPYLLVTESITEKPATGGASAGKTESCVADVKYLPDYTQEYVIIPHYWLGSVALKPTLADGWNLTNFDSTVDTKIPETITAVANLAKAAAPGGIGALGTEVQIQGPPQGNVSPGLYAIVPSGNGLALDTDWPVFVAKGTICSSLTTVAKPQPQPQKNPGGGAGQQ